MDCLSHYTLSCFGKLPIHPDFIRFQTAGEEIRALDQWFQEGIYFAKTRLGRQWPETFHNAESWHFVFHSAACPSFLVGVFIPSHDQGGRSYPFFLFLRVDKKSFGGPFYFAPLCFSSFLKEAQDIVKTKWDGTDLKTFLSRLQDLSVPAPLDIGLIQKAYLQNLEHQTNHLFWTHLFGDFNDPKKYQLDRNLVDMLRPLRGISANMLRFALKFPLVPQNLIDAGKEVYDIPFWFDFVLQLLKADDDPVFFWHRNASKGPPSMLAFFSPPSPKQFLSLLKPEQNNDAWFNLVSTDGPNPQTIRNSIRADRLALLEDEALSMADFLAAVHKIN